MTVRRSHLILLAALVLPPTSTIIATQLRYSPDLFRQDALATNIGFAAGLAAGLLLLLCLPFASRFGRFAAAAVYLPVMMGLSWLAGLMTACGNGDCL